MRMIKIKQQYRDVLSSAIQSLGKFDVLEHHKEYKWTGKYKCLNDFSYLELDRILEQTTVDESRNLVNLASLGSSIENCKYNY